MYRGSLNTPDERCMYLSGSDAKFGGVHFSGPPHSGPLGIFIIYLFIYFYFIEFGFYTPKLL